MTDPVHPPGAEGSVPASEPEQSVVQERSISPVAGRFGAGRGGKIAGLAALVIGCGVFYAAIWKSDGPKPDKTPQQPARQIVPYEIAQATPTTSDPTLSNPGQQAPTLISGAGAATVPALTSNGTISAEAAQGGVARPPNAQSVPDAQAQVRAEALRARAAQIQAIRAAPLLAYSRGGVDTASASVGAPFQTLREAVSNPAVELDALRQGSSLGRATARPIGDRNFLILAGTAIPCVLQTAMDTATPGYVSCVIPTDIYSENGAVILLEKGSKVLGEYRSGLRQGQKRLFVLWTRAVTPAGIAIALASPAADALGRAGFDGAIDPHFWERFGGALLLSVVDDGTYAAAGKSSNDQSARLPSDAAAVALQNSVNIPPSLRKAQGAEVSIFAAQDFDFSAVYGLRNR